MFFDKHRTIGIFLYLKDIKNKKNYSFCKIYRFPDFSNFPENSDFGPFLCQNFRSGNILDAFKRNDIASATLYLSFTTKIKALPVLVLKI